MPGSVLAHPGRPSSPRCDQAELRDLLLDDALIFSLTPPMAVTLCTTATIASAVSCTAR